MTVTPAEPALYLVSSLAHALVCQANEHAGPDKSYEARFDALTELWRDVEDLIKPDAVKPVRELAFQLIDAD